MYDMNSSGKHTEGRAKSYMTDMSGQETDMMTECSKCGDTDF